MNDEPQEKFCSNCCPLCGKDLTGGRCCEKEDTAHQQCRDKENTAHNTLGGWMSSEM